MEQTRLGFKLRRVLIAPRRGVPCTPVQPWKVGEEEEDSGSTPRGGSLSSTTVILSKSRRRRCGSLLPVAAPSRSSNQVKEKVEEEEENLIFLLEELREERRRRRNLAVKYSVLSDLCDELAEGIREYEEESRERDRDRRIRPVLHVAESWLDARSQMKAAESSGDRAARRLIDGRISGEIEEFLRSRRSDRRRSVVSISGPWREESRRSDPGEDERGETLEERLMEARIDEKQARSVPSRLSSAGTCILSPLTENCPVRRLHS